MLFEEVLGALGGRTQMEEDQREAVGLYGPLLTPACLVTHQVHKSPLRHTPAAMSTCPMHRARSPQVKPSGTFSPLPFSKLLSIFLSVLSEQRTQHLTFLIVTFSCADNTCEPLHKERAWAVTINLIFVLQISFIP